MRQSGDRAHAIVHGILQRVDAFSQGTAYDDVTVVSVRLDAGHTANVLPFERLAQV